MAATLRDLVQGCRTSVRQLSKATSLEISDRTSTVTSVLRGDHRPSTFRPHYFSPSPSHRTIRRDVNWAADRMIRLTINRCTYIPEMSRCTEHQFVTQASERRTDRTHTHAADKPLSTQLNSLAVCAAPTSALRCGLQQRCYHTVLPRAALRFANAGAWKTHGYLPCLSNSSARSCKYARLKLCYLAALYATAENTLQFVWCVADRAS